MVTHRSKRLVAAAAGLGLLIAAVTAASQLILLPSFETLEVRDAIEHIERVRDVLLDDVAELDRQLADWAAWDETYAYVATRDPDYVKTNIPDATFTDLRLNMLLILDRSGRILFARGADLERGAPAKVPSSLTPHLAPGGALLAHRSETSRTAGILLLPEGPVLIASRPILTSERTGPLRGTMIWGRYLTRGEVARLGAITHLDVYFEAQGYPGWSESLAEFSSSRINVRPLDRRQILGAVLIPDIHGDPSLVLRIRVPRNITAQGREAIRYFLLWFTIMGALAAVLAVTLFEKLVVSRDEQARTEHNFGTLVQQASPVAIITLDGEGRVLTWNTAAERIFGWAEAEVRNRPAPHIPEDRRAEARGIHGRVLHGEVVIEQETVRSRKDGRLIDVSLSAAPFIGGNGAPPAIMAVLADITSRKDAEAGMQRQLQRLAALRTIDAAITGSLDLQLTLNVLVDQVITHLGVAAVGLLVFNPVTQLLEHAATRGFQTEALKHTRLRLGEGHAGTAALERRVIHIPDLRVAAGDLRRSPLLSREGFQAYYAVPLMAKGEVKGVLEIFHRGPLQGDERWMEFLEALAGQAAIAIDNASLFSNLQRANVDLTVAYDTTLEGWSKALDLRDHETEGHTRRVTDLTMHLARALAVPQADLVHVRRGALLHDIGKMGIPDSILRKPGPLSDEEWAVMRQHPGYAFDLLSPIPYLRPALEIPFCHHEKWDGSGYPRGLRGMEIPLAARIFAVVDVWDALTSDRPYRRAWPEEKAFAHIREQSEKHFDPDVVQAFLRLQSTLRPRTA